MPNETLEPLTELFRHRFIETLVKEKYLSRKKADQMLTWKHSRFILDAGKKPVSSLDVEGRRHLAEYMFRAPFSLEKGTVEPDKPKGDLSLQTQLAHQTELPSLHRHRFHRRHGGAHSTEGPAMLCRDSGTPSGEAKPHRRSQTVRYYPPPPDQPFDIQTLEPFEVPIHWSWSDQTDPPPEDWWQDNAEWQALELPLDDGCTPVLDAIDPIAPEDVPVFL